MTDLTVFQKAMEKAEKENNSTAYAIASLMMKWEEGKQLMIDTIGYFDYDLFVEQFNKKLGL